MSIPSLSQPNPTLMFLQNTAGNNQGTTQHPDDSQPITTSIRRISLAALGTTPPSAGSASPEEDLIFGFAQISNETSLSSHGTPSSTHTLRGSQVRDSIDLAARLANETPLESSTVGTSLPSPSSLSLSRSGSQDPSLYHTPYPGESISSLDSSEINETLTLIRSAIPLDPKPPTEAEPQILSPRTISKRT